MSLPLHSLPQGDPRLLDDPIAQELLASTELGRLAYVAADGTPRVVPVGWIWLDGALVQLVAASDWVPLPDSWVANSHRAQGDETEPAGKAS